MQSSVVHTPAHLADAGAIFDIHEQWRCGCGREHAFGAYAAAHWEDELVHNCDCGQARVFLAGEVLEFEA